MALPALKPGDEVYVFYRMGKRCLPQRKYLAVLSPRQGAYRPRIGISDGWVPARVAAEHDPGSQVAEVKVEYSWPHFFTQRGYMAECDSGWTELYRRADVMLAANLPSAGPRRCLVPPGSQPELAIITFRWGGMNEVVAPGQWGETGSSVSDVFVDSFVDSAVSPRIGNRYEVWTVYIEDHSDMVRIADAAHLIFGPNHPAMRAKHTCAMYHLYPTAFEENCIPNRETGEDQGAALVNQSAFFRMVKAVERSGIPTRFPHPSGFYELLASKRWTSMMSLVPHLRVPPTVALPRMLIERGCAAAAESALTALCAVKHNQALLRNEAPPQGPITKGVAKLGFSWEALDVKFWEHRAGLEEAISNLTQVIEISQEMTGQPHDLESIMVQEYMTHDLEMRLYAIEGVVDTIIYTKFCKIKDNREFGDFKELFSLNEAAQQWMGGDVAALESGERQCREVSAHWLKWIQSLICEVPPAIRFDFFVGRGAQPGQAVVWTLEICELGFSMLGAKDLPDKVFAAMFRSCLDGASVEQAAAAEQRPAAAPAPSAAAAPAQSPAGGEGGGGAPAGETAAGAPSGGADGQDPAPANTDVPQQEVVRHADSDTPAEVFVTVPKSPDVTQDQQKCSGTYALVPNLKPNGLPVWVHSRADRWLYYGKDQHWYVGDEEEQEMNFECEQGYVRHRGCKETLPHELAGPWERGPEWTPDHTIVVSLDAAVAVAKASKGKSKSKRRGR